MSTSRELRERRRTVRRCDRCSTLLNGRPSKWCSDECRDASRAAVLLRRVRSREEISPEWREYLRDRDSWLRGTDDGLAFAMELARRLRIPVPGDDSGFR